MSVYLRFVFTRVSQRAPLSNVMPLKQRSVASKPRDVEFLLNVDAESGRIVLGDLGN